MLSLTRVFPVSEVTKKAKGNFYRFFRGEVMYSTRACCKGGSVEVVVTVHRLPSEQARNRARKGASRDPLLALGCEAVLSYLPTKVVEEPILRKKVRPPSTWFG